ncbi:MAG: arginine repressor, partial [Streptococcus sp.]
MKKTERHLLIQQRIRNEKLSTQKEIQDRLEAKGIAVTQTTLS